MRDRVISISIFLLLAGCSQQQQPPAGPPAAEPEPVAVTRWSDRTELFMEYPPLVVGSKGRAAVHFTDIRTFAPVVEGAASIDLKQNGQIVQSFMTEGPSRPGIFGIDLEPKQPGTYSFSVSLRTPQIEDVPELGEVTVYSSATEVPAETAVPQEEGIPFLKEQQWTLDFATEIAAERSIRESLRVSGEIQPRSGGEVEVAAPITGRIASSSQIPAIGSSVSTGQALATLVPPTPNPADLPTLQLEIAEATAHLEHARRDRERVERLLEVGAIPEKRLHEAREEETLVTARLKAAEARLAQYESSRRADGPPSDQSLFTVRAPIAGVIARVNATPGSNAAQGDSLFRIVAVDRVYVVAHVPEAEASRITQLTSAEIEIPGTDRTLPVRGLVSASRLIDPASRTLSVIYELDNSDRRLAVGQALPVRLFLSQASSAVAIPEGAVIDDGGRPVVFVQLDGEAFARRPVRLGPRASGYVQVLEGVRPGERVVSRGAYLIRLAALSPTIPAHGHVH